MTETVRPDHAKAHRAAYESGLLIAGTALVPRRGTIRLGYQGITLIEGFVGSVGSYTEAVHSALPRGHGVAAEHASNIIDRIRGRVVAHLGSDNACCGPDRAVDGILIQTKYCASGGKCIAECFDATGFRYWNPDGTPMQIEVPKDLHDAAIQALAERIRRGQVAGVSDPAVARSIVRKGHLTYDQARDLGVAGTVESLGFDLATGVGIASRSAILSAGATLVRSTLSGAGVRVSIIAAGASAARGGGITMVSHVLARQFGRTAFDRTLAPATDWVVAKIGSPTLRTLAAATGRPLAQGAAAAGHVSRVIRGHVAVSAATGIVLASIDLTRFLSGRQTGRETAENLATSGAGLAGGTAGWLGGTLAFAVAGSVVPGIGTGVGIAIGGMAGSFGGGALARSGCAIVIAKLGETERLMIVAGGMLAVIETRAEAADVRSHIDPNTTRISVP